MAKGKYINEKRFDLGGLLVNRIMFFKFFTFSRILKDHYMSERFPRPKEANQKWDKRRGKYFNDLSFSCPYFLLPFKLFNLMKRFLNQLTVREQRLAKFISQWGYVVFYHFANTALRMLCYSTALSVLRGNGRCVVS